MILEGALLKTVFEWFAKNWKSVLLICILAVFLGSAGECQRRGARIKELKIEKRSLDSQLTSAKEDYKADLEDCGEKIVEIEDKAEEAKRKSEATINELHADLAAVTEEADRAWRESAQTRTEVATQIDRAETAEEKIDVFLDAVNKRLKR